MSAPVVLVTGAAGGMGGAIARRFAAGGWRVAATDLDDAALSVLEAEVPLVARVPADLRFAEACHGVLGETMARAGRLDALVNAAGVWREGPVESFTEADFDLLIAVNLKSAFFMCAAAIPALRATRGAIVNISSDAGRHGNVGAAAYCASKGGLTNFTKALALDLAPDLVRANVVSPGDTATPMLDFQAERYGGGDPAAYKAALLARYPQGTRARFVRPEEVAELVFFLCQPTAAAITGADYSIDFGYTAGK
ncbi:MAG: SDR family oxidoreductase [Steroidobacteraceae bacterium]|jgi:NAD(P)-dependent dehydrogenase (short-subunit alcohol dehydrogenase family)|nr:SDR family oxidoreductase [Steroidobacteraceae bacterium]